MTLLFARPVAPPTPTPQRYGRLRMEWVGWDGSEWPLTDPLTGLALIRDGVEGLHLPEITEQTTQSAAIAGDAQSSWQAEPREVFWPLWLYADTTDEWLDRQAAFFRTLHPDMRFEGTWRVTAGSKVRELRLTAVMKGDHQYRIDPLQRGWATYSLTMKAHKPYWVGDLIEAGPWRASSTASFFPGPPFHIGSSATLTNAEITNPCPVDLWPTWHLEDALSDIELGVAGQTIVIPFDMVDGDVLDIDTDPEFPTATLNGVDVLADLGLQPYAPIPAFSTTPLTISASGSGSVSCAIRELWFSAF